MAKRLFYQGSLSQNPTKDCVVIDGSEYNHIANTMRARIGDEVVLFNGDGMDYHGTIVDINKKSVTAELSKAVPNQVEPNVKLTLFQAVTAKVDKLEIIVQKLTELGAIKVVPVITEFSNHRRDAVRCDRLNKIALEAAKQCGRSTIPEIADVIDFDHMTTVFSSFDLVIMPYENERSTPFNIAFKGVECAHKGFSVAIVIGAEGGFSSREVAQCQREGAQVVSMGSRILRSETAAISAAAVTLFALGEWSK